MPIRIVSPVATGGVELIDTIITDGVTTYGGTAYAINHLLKEYSDGTYVDAGVIAGSGGGGTTTTTSAVVSDGTTPVDGTTYPVGVLVLGYSDGSYAGIGNVQGAAGPTTVAGGLGAQYEFFADALAGDNTGREVVTTLAYSDHEIGGGAEYRKTGNTGTASTGNSAEWFDANGVGWRIRGFVDSEVTPEQFGYIPTYNGITPTMDCKPIIELISEQFFYRNPAAGGSSIYRPTGGTIRFSTATYRYSSRPRLTRGITLAGNGRESTEQRFINKDGGFIFADVGNAIQDFFTVRGMQINCYGDGGTANSGLEFRVEPGTGVAPSLALNLKDVYIRGFYDLISYEAVVGLTIDNVNGSHATRYGLYSPALRYDGSTAVTSTTGVVSNCYFHSCLEENYRIEKSAYFAFIGCASDSCDGNAYHFGNAAQGTSSRGITMSACGSERAKGWAISVESNSSVTTTSFRYVNHDGQLNVAGVAQDSLGVAYVAGTVATLTLIDPILNMEHGEAVIETDTSAASPNYKIIMQYPKRLAVTAPNFGTNLTASGRGVLVT